MEVVATRLKSDGHINSLLISQTNLPTNLANPAGHLHFALLTDWLGEAQLDRVGCFRYEAVDGAAANALAEPVPEEVKEERWHRFMQRQHAISMKRLKRKVGQRRKVIIDEVGPTVAKGRSEGDAPEIDGTVTVASRRPLRVGEIATVKIERADAYDLHGTVVGF